MQVLFLDLHNLNVLNHLFPDHPRIIRATIPSTKSRPQKNICIFTNLFSTGLHHRSAGLRGGKQLPPYFSLITPFQRILTDPGTPPSAPLLTAEVMMFLERAESLLANIFSAVSGGRERSSNGGRRLDGAADWASLVFAYGIKIIYFSNSTILLSLGLMV